MSRMAPATAPLWKTLRAPDLTAEALIAAMRVRTMPVDVEKIAKRLGVKVMAVELRESVGRLWFKGNEAHLSVDRQAMAARRRFTVAALLCHLLRHPEGTYC